MHVLVLHIDILWKFRQVLILLSLETAIAIEIIHLLVLREVLKFTANSLVLAYVQLLVDIIAIDDEND